MEIYLINTIQDLIVTAVLAGIVMAYARVARGSFGMKVVTGGIVIGLAASVVMAFMKQNTALVSTGDWNLRIFTVSLVAVAVMLVAAIALAVVRRSGKGRAAGDGPAPDADAPASAAASAGAAGVLQLVILFALAVFVMLRVFYKVPDVINYPANFGISADNYISTDFVFRITGYLLGIVVSVVAFVAIVKAFKALGKRGIAVVTAIIVAVICFVQSMTLCQILIARRVITRDMDIYSTLFPLTSWVSNHAIVFTLAILVAAVVLACIVIALSLRDAEPYANPAEHRKNKAKWRNRRRWSICLIVCLAFSLLTLTAIKDYANRGPEITESEECEVRDGNVYVALEQVDDGHLHRFTYESQAGVTVQPEGSAEYTTDGGVGIRFIVIKKPGANSYGVGLDACEICGETGYYERDGQVVCKLCDVVMNINTIGFKGGCNPIPIKYSVEGGNIVIPTDGLAEYEKTFKS